MKIGDLICYNAGGMKSKTLGMVIDLQDDSWNGGMYPTILIEWFVVGKWMPRRESSSSLYSFSKEPSWKNIGKSISSGERVWHRHGNWFEKIKPLSEQK